jgi:hypothetical protein|tara:strand:+ start:246 stop:494 length:249 start_codon:yes stop_codon:yes gene_type:complete
MDLIVIHAQDIGEDSLLAIGVASNLKLAKKMIKEYYGLLSLSSESIIEIDSCNIDDGIEINVTYLNSYKIYLYLEPFTLNEI